MHISPLTSTAQYNSTTNVQQQTEESSHANGKEFPPKDVVTISHKAKIMAEVERIRNGKESPGSRALAYGELIYVGPGNMSIEEANARMDLWRKYENTPTMDSFRRSAIKLYERETQVDTADKKIEEKLKTLYNNFHIKLSKLETNQNFT